MKKKTTTGKQKSKVKANPLIIVKDDCGTLYAVPASVLEAFVVPAAALKAAAAKQKAGADVAGQSAGGMVSPGIWPSPFHSARMELAQEVTLYGVKG